MTSVPVHIKLYFFDAGKDSIYLLDDKCVFEFVGEELGKVSRPLDLRDNTRPEWQEEAMEE